MVKKHKVFNLNIDAGYNFNLLPVTINDSEIIDLKFEGYSDNRFLRSQYSLEIVMQNMFSKYNCELVTYEESEFVFIPIYLFLTSWKTKYFYNVQDTIKSLNELYSTIDKITSDGKKIIMVYSDVMWEDERCFINHFNFNKNVYFVCYEGVHNMENQIPVPYVTHIKSEPLNYEIPSSIDKKFLISYVGRERNETTLFKDIEIYTTTIKNNNHWISLNDKSLYDKIDNLYLNSYFSLQPHGDKKSRKGFYHSLLMGCIPVVFEDNYQIYEEVFSGLVKIEDICVVLNKQDELVYNEILENEKSKIDAKIKNIDKIKNLLLYYENDSTLVDNILNKIEFKNKI